MQRCESPQRCFFCSNFAALSKKALPRLALRDVGQASLAHLLSQTCSVKYIKAPLWLVRKGCGRIAGVFTIRILHQGPLVAGAAKLRFARWCNPDRGVPCVGSTTGEALASSSAIQGRYLSVRLVYLWALDCYAARQQHLVRTEAWIAFSSNYNLNNTISIMTRMKLSYYSWFVLQRLVFAVER